MGIIDRRFVRPTDRVCGSCKFWSPIDDFTGCCTCNEALSSMIDVTEVRFSCDRYVNFMTDDPVEEYQD